MLANDVGCPFPSIHTRNPEEIMLPLKMELKAKKDAVSRRFTLLHWLFAKILMSENLDLSVWFMWISISSKINATVIWISFSLELAAL